MKKAIMKIIPSILCCIFLVCACGNAANTPTAAEVESIEVDKQDIVSSAALEAADALYELGLFNGTGTDADGKPIYELERVPNRHEAVAMLVRLLGKEAAAEASSWTAPFTDVAEWAKPYVGYAYENGITLGTSATTYGGKADTTATQYITFMLRTLGYSSETDFKWNAAWELSDKIGMTNGEYNAYTNAFTRGDMAIISYSALSCKMTNGMTLYDYLVAEGAIRVEGETDKDVPPENGNDVSPETGEDASLPEDEEELSDNGEIKTPYLTLHLDEALSDCMAVVHRQGTPYILEFYAVIDDKADQPIFDIFMGDGADGNLGIFDTDIGEVPVSIIMYSFEPDESWTEDEINTVLATQEVSNDLISQLMIYRVETNSPEPALPEGEPETDISDSVEIKTPFCTLTYPGEWEKYLYVEQTEADDYRVTVCAVIGGKEPIVLFTLIFGGDYGEQLGAIKTQQGQYVPVNVLIEELECVNYSEEEMMILYEMQEAVNVMIAQMPLE